MRYYSVKYWPGREEAVLLKSPTEKHFDTQDAAIKFAMRLHPHFRVDVQEHDDALGG